MNVLSLWHHNIILLRKAYYKTAETYNLMVVKPLSNKIWMRTVMYAWSNYYRYVCFNLQMRDCFEMNFVDANASFYSKHEQGFNPIYYITKKKDIYIGLERPRGQSIDCHIHSLACACWWLLVTKIRLLVFFPFRFCFSKASLITIS